MKKIGIILVLILALLAFVGCERMADNDPTAPEPERKYSDRFIATGQSFVLREKVDNDFGDTFYVVKDTKTGILYLYDGSGYGGGLCPWYGPDGLPMKEE